MVGVPWSNACVSCRRRRKGCDGVRPGCGQCLKRGVHCPGYAKAMKLVMFDPAGIKSQKKTQPARDYGTAATIHTPSQIVPRLAAGSPRFLPNSCVRSAFQSQTYGHFLDAYLPSHSHTWPSLDTNLLSMVPTTGWLQLAASKSTTDVLLDNALAALTMVHLERVEKKEGYFQSPVLYSKAINELARRLRTNDAACLSDATLCAVTAITTYEIEAGTTTQTKSWLSHVRGAAHLVRLRGERNFDNKFSQHLFMNSQLNEILHAVSSRKRMPDLTDCVGFDYSKELSSCMRLFGLLQELPALIEYADAIKSNAGSSTREGAGSNDEDEIVNYLLVLSSRMQTFELQLAEWYTRLEREQSQRVGSAPSLFWEEPSTLYRNLPPKHPGRVYSTFLCFPDIAIAEQVVLYWTARLFLPRLLISTHARLKSTGQLPSADKYSPEASFSNITSDSLELATNVTRSLEYFLHPDVGLMELNFIGFPMNLSMACLKTLKAPQLAYFDVIRCRLREMDTGLGDFLDKMVGMGGGLQAAKMLVS